MKNLTHSRLLAVENHLKHIPITAYNALEPRTYTYKPTVYNKCHISISGNENSKQCKMFLEHFSSTVNVGMLGLSFRS